MEQKYYNEEVIILISQNYKNLILIVLIILFFSFSTISAETTVLRLGINEDVRNLNPYMGYGGTETFVIGFVYDTLLGWDNEEGLLPNLADSWHLEDGGRTIVFHLNPQAKWHDGVPVTSEDVVFSFNFIMRNQFPGFMAVLGAFAGVEAIDTHTVALYVRQPSLGNVRFLGTAPSIIPAHIWSEIEDPRNYPNTENPIGTGPFRLVEHRVGQHILLEYTGDHYRFDYEIDQIMLRLIRDETVGVMSLQRGDLDALRWAVDADLADPISRNPHLYPNINVAVSEASGVNTLMFNLRRETIEDKALRQAIHYAIDSQKLIDDILLGYGSMVGRGLVPNTLPHYNEAYPPEDRDLAKAKSLLIEAGYSFDGNILLTPDGQRVSLEILVMNTPTHISIGELITIHLREIGINARFSPLTPEAHRNRLMAADFDAALTNLNFANEDMMFFYYHSSRGQIADGRVTGFNYGGHICEEYDEISTLMRFEIDTEKRHDLLLQLQDMIAEAYYHTPLYSANRIMLYSEENFTNWIIKADTGFDNGENYRSLISVN